MATRDAHDLAQELLALQQQAVVGGQRLDDQRRDALAVQLEDPGHARFVIERGDERVGGHRFRNARAVGRRHLGKAGACFHEHGVHVPVIAAFELEHLRATRGGARHAQRRHHGLGAGIDEADLLDPAQARGDQFRQLQRACLRGAVAPAARDRIERCRAHLGILVAEEQRPPGHAEVDVGVAVDIDQPATVRFPDEPRHAAHAPKRAHRRMHAAGGDAQRALEQRFGGTRGAGHAWLSHSRAERAP